MEKYFLYIGEARIGIKYDTRKKELTVGGFGRFLTEVENVMRDYFDTDPAGSGRACKQTWTQVNKVRLVASNMPRWLFVKGIGKMTEHNLSLSKTTVLGRIMR